MMKRYHLRFGLWAAMGIGLGSAVGAGGAALARQANAMPEPRQTSSASSKLQAPAKPSLTTVGSTKSDADQAGGALCAGGMESELGLEISPANVANNGYGDELTLAVGLTDRFAEKGNVKLRYAVEIRDDAGELVEAETISPVLDLKEKGKHQFNVSTSELPDGFYRCTITAVARKKVTSSETESTFYWKVKDGFVEVLDFTDWQSEAPNAGRAVAL